MKNHLIFILLIVVSGSCTPKKTPFVKKVNPFIGTGGHGHTYPGATAPFGMVQLSPDTRVAGWDACSGYHYSDSTLLGFSHTHLSGTGVGDYGDILFTPRVSANDSLPIGFNHNDETAWAGFYSVKLKNGIRVNLTTTSRVGIHQYIYPDKDSALVIIDLNHGIGPDRLLAGDWHIVNNKEITGYRKSSGWAKDQMVYFTAEFSAPFKAKATSKNRVLLSFGIVDHPLVIKVGLSSVSEINARENIYKEAPRWDFNVYVKQAEKVWDKELGKVKAEFLDEDDEKVFYTALYHASLAPNIFSDINGEYRGMDKATHTTLGTQYTVFSLWDTFRSAHPLFTLINKQRDVNMINTMLRMYEQNGLLPVWELAANETGTMIGYHAIPVIADAVVKRIPGFDYNLALEAMQASASQDKLGLKYYREMGFIPAEKEHESVSKTLEYAYDDWCIAQTASFLGNEAVAKKYLQRAQYYKNLYNPSTGFMRPKRNGNWLQDFDPFEVSGNYTEANAWQYNLFVPQDISYLDTLYNSASTLENKLDSLFSAKTILSGRQQPDIAGMIGQYAHGNEPSHNFAYLYNYVDRPWKTQAVVHQITSTLYKNQPDGLAGNEDCGQMSAWYVFSALGLYPTVPGIAEYSIGSPKVKKAVIVLENGTHFNIKTRNLSKENYFVQSVSLNNRPLKRSFLYHEEIIKGGILEFTMGNKPVSLWLHDTIESPVSRITGKKINITPIIDGGEMTFTDSTNIEIKSIEPKVEIYYTVDGKEPSRNSYLYAKSFTIDSTTQVKAMAVSKHHFDSKIAIANFIKIPYGRKIKLINPYSHLYTGNSKMALIDHIHGSKNYRDGWQGYHQVDLEAIVDLGKAREVKEVKGGFLQDTYAWIFFPKEVIIELSNNGRHFDHKKIIKNLVDPKEEGQLIQTLGTTYPSLKARYIRIKAINMGVCPDWHKGAGNPAWLFADEIDIKTN